MVSEFSKQKSGLLAKVRQATKASDQLSNIGMSDRNRALRAIAHALTKYQDEILEANTLDLETSREMAVPDLITDWLRLTPERIHGAAQVLQALSNLAEPVCQPLPPPYAEQSYQISSQLSPLGVVALVYEAFPDLGAIAAGFCLKTGNSLILKGSSEASQSNAAIAEIIQVTLMDLGMPEACLSLLPSDQGATIRDLVTLDQGLQLVIPYGRASLVQQVSQHATVPVLRPAMGNCYLYWSASGSLETVRWMILSSHHGEPDAVNAVEKVLLHQDLNSDSLMMLWNSLQEKGFELRGDPELAAEFPQLQPVQPEEWHHAYLKRIVAFKRIEQVDAATSWINKYSSGHADSIATESYSESRQFASRVASSVTYINASPRFVRCAKDSNSFAFGMSRYRGPIGLTALMRLRQSLQA